MHLHTHSEAHTPVHSSKEVCDGEILVFIAPCSLTPSNPSGVAELYGQFTPFYAFSLPLSPRSLESNPLSCRGQTSDMCGIDSSHAATATWTHMSRPQTSHTELGWLVKYRCNRTSGRTMNLFSYQSYDSCTLA